MRPSTRTSLQFRGQENILVEAILKRTIKTHGLLRNPARKVTKLCERYEPNAYHSYSPDEIEALGTAAASEQDRAIYLTAAFTGLRMGDLIALLWVDVDFDTEALRVYGSYSLGTLTAPQSGLTRTVPMAEQIDKMLEDHRERVLHARADLVFPGERGEFLDGSALRRRYKKALKKAELRPLRFHDPRHTFGSIAIDQATIVQLQARMGHADVQTTMKYCPTAAVPATRGCCRRRCLRRSARRGQAARRPAPIAT